MTTPVLITAYIISVLLTILHVIFHGSRPVRSLSWVLVALLLPFIGVILYITFGINRRQVKFFKPEQAVKSQLYGVSLKNCATQEKQPRFNDKKSTKLAGLLTNSAHFIAHPGNKVTVLKNGAETFEAIFAALEKAEKFIHLEYYILEEGILLDRCYELLKKKIAQNVEVRILYDALGSYQLPKKTIKKFRKTGIKMHPVMPLRFGNFLFTLNYRNHRKIIIIDGKIGFTGGFNISDSYIKPTSELGVWKDLHLCLEGPVVDSLHRVFVKDYYFATQKKSLLKNDYLPSIPKQGNTTVQMVSGGPDSDHPAIMYQYIGMINLAEHHIYISNPYFIPNRAMLEALKIAILSGVTIKLLVPEKSDSWLAKYSMFSFFEELLCLGVDIYQQKDSFLHNKLMIIDGEIISIGSGNFDYRSFEHNFETNVLIYDQKIAENICREFVENCNQSIALDHEIYRNRPRTQKLLERIARLFSPLL